MTGPHGHASPAAFRRALTDRLQGLAATSRWPLQHLQRQMAYDRLLERLYLADDGWVVKGAAAQPRRSSRDGPGGTAGRRAAVGGRPAGPGAARPAGHPGPGPLGARLRGRGGVRYSPGRIPWMTPWLLCVPLSTRSWRAPLAEPGRRVPRSGRPDRATAPGSGPRARPPRRP